MTQTRVSKNTPRVVKFSGGRSSGMMLMKLLEENALRPERGDVIIFNNTSAEHPATYDFVRRMKALAENEHNIPFFWIEYQTYEDAYRYGYKRWHSYKLVNEHPYSDSNPSGYSCNGEVFEEMISLDALPNMLARTCTIKMKVFVTNAFLSDWFAQKEGIERLGHQSATPRATDANIIKLHKSNQGSIPDNILLKKRAFVRSRPFVREQAKWEDFTDSKLCFNNEKLKGSVLGNKAQLYGDTAVTYVSYLGIRKDEEIRIDKIRARINGQEKRSQTSLLEQPVNEKVLAPLVENKITKEMVLSFWKKQAFDLALPDTGLFSNCVYCPLKGRRKLLQIAEHEMSEGALTEYSPASIDWWIRVEKQYSRNLKTERRDISNKDVKFVGFFGATDKLVYSQIKEQALSSQSDGGKKARAEYLEDEDYIPCNCTD